MRINNEDIARMARQLRDEENSQQHVAPWRRRQSHFQVPTWLVAIPAATFIGFFIGLWTSSKMPDTDSLAAIVDTVYVTVEKSETASDSVQRGLAALNEQQLDTAVSIPPSQTVALSAGRSKASHRRPKAAPPVQPAVTATVGRSIADDHIRYDLLVKN